MTLAALVLLAFGLSCDLFRTHKEPKLILKKDPTPAGHYFFLGCPVLAHDSTRLYYIQDTTLNVSGRTAAIDLKGDLRVFSLGDSSDRLLLPGLYHSISLSPDGRQIVLLNGWQTRWYDSAPMFVLLDTGASVVDSVFVDSSARWGTYDVSFSRTDEELVFNTMDQPVESTAFYALRPVAGERRRHILTLPGRRCGFDLFDGDSIYIDTLEESYPSVNPVNNKWVISDWTLWDRVTGSGTPLDRFSEPLSIADVIQWPGWTPDGRSIVFAAFIGGGIRSRPLGYGSWIASSNPRAAAGSCTPTVADFSPSPPAVSRRPQIVTDGPPA